MMERTNESKLNSFSDEDYSQMSIPASVVRAIASGTRAHAHDTKAIIKNAINAEEYTIVFCND